MRVVIKFDSRRLFRDSVALLQRPLCTDASLSKMRFQLNYIRTVTI